MVAAIGFAAVIGWVFSFSVIGPDLWNWFVAPMGAPVIGKAQAWGLLVCRWVFFQKISLAKDERTDDEKMGHSVMAVCFLWFAYGVGWIVQHLT